MPTSSANGARPAAYLDVREVAAGYGREPVVTDLSIAVGQGEVACVVGPNGSGKSTLLKALLGVIPVMRGSVAVGGKDVTNMRCHALARLGLGYVPQTNNVFDTLTVEENLRLGGYLLHKGAAQARVDEVVARFSSLAPLLRRSAHKLSGGERKLVAIGRVMMLRPSVYVLDEPTSGLSPDLADRVLGEYVTGLAASGAAILLVEQRAKSALAISDWGYLLVAGRLMMSDAAATMLADTSVAEMFLGQAAEEPGGSTRSHAGER
jgi:ABC-type branched-subunit amino acid transport system ATPase component